MISTNVYEIETHEEPAGVGDTNTLHDIVKWGADGEGEILATIYNDKDLAEKIRRIIEKGNSGNALMTLRPYKWGHMWVFDDPAVGLRKEPFVNGVPEILEDILDQHDVDGEDGFYLTFSATPFPGAQRELVWVEEESGGNWYETTAADGETPMEGWLCPALFKYYDEAPDKLYAKVEPRVEGDKIKPDEPSYEENLNYFGNFMNGLFSLSSHLRDDESYEGNKI